MMQQFFIPAIGREMPVSAGGVHCLQVALEALTTGLLKAQMDTK